MHARSFRPAIAHRFAGSARRVGVAATVVVVGLGGVIATASPSIATPASPTVTVLNNVGTPASNVAVGATLAVTAAAPITVAGATSQTITQTWNAAQSLLTPSSIVTPEGWTKTYTTDGTTWSSTLPTDPTTVSGVQSTGAVFSDGTSSGLQVSTATGTGTLKTAPVFAPSSGGDGWDAFTSGLYVMNAWHHNGGSYNLDCHLIATGVSCGSVYSVSGYETSTSSSGTVDAGKVYSIVGQIASNSVGVLCTNVSALPFAPCGYVALEVGTANYTIIGSAQQSGTKIYAPLNDGNVVCFDISTGAACVGQPYALASYTGSAGTQITAFSTAVGPYIFITASKIWCLTAADGSACAGVWPVGSYSTNLLTGAVPMRDTAGTLTGVCMIRPAGNCFTLTGATTTMPAGLTSLLASSEPDAGISIGGYGQFGFGATKQYWFAGGWGPDTPACYDWTTDAACAGFQTTTPIGNVRYTIRVDATNPNCLWSNGDDGSIAPFDANTGQPGCQGSDPVVDIPYTAVVPRLSCTEAGRIRNWQNITFTPPGAIAMTALRVTVLDSSGVAIAGYTSLTPNSSGVVDLSALAVATSGTQPTFEVTAIGASSPNASAISAAVTYTSDAPQLCFTLTTIHNCPTLAPGVSAGATVAVSDVALGGSTVATASGVPTTTPLSAAITRANMAGCVGTVSGTATQTFTSGAPDAPLANGTVYLLDSFGTAVASTVTAADGTYSFANANPAAYTAQMSLVTHALTVTAGGSAVQNFSVPYVAPTKPATAAFTQLGGANRDATAAMVATTMYPLAGSASVVVLARDDLYADGLTGSPLANAFGGPLLLSPTASLSSATQAAIAHVLMPGGLVICLGGTSAISPSVAATLQQLGYQVERIGGVDRYATATLIADKIGTKHAVAHVYVATGLNFADALSAADAAGLNNGVVLLTADTIMPGSTNTWLAAHTSAPATAIGGQAAAADPTATALVGSNRYATAAL
ncbi:MAG TPA: cell wall-binding repeat-containing protein, partial [Acidothermaceae bacterium]